MNIITTTAVVASLILSGCATAEGKIVVNATTQDHKCLAEAIYYESGSEPRAGKIAVGHVIVNRANSGIYPSTICKVIYQVDAKKCQFGWNCRWHHKPVGSRWESSKEIATLILAGKTQDLSKGALSFYNTRHKIYNKNKMQQTASIGRHIFWRPTHLKLAKGQGD